MPAYVIRHAGYRPNRVLEELDRLEGRKRAPAAEKPQPVKAAAKKKPAAKKAKRK